MITDRRRLGAGSDDALVERVAAAARAGVHLIQIRERDLDGRTLTRLVERCARAVRGTRARILVNDRVDVAIAGGAHGVHLRGDSVAAVRVRAIAPEAFVVGRSVHTIDEARDAARDGGLDYLLFGTVFETPSKPGTPAGGTAMLAEVSGSTALPVLAVGGVTLERVPELARAGVAGVAAIGLFADCSLEALQVIVRQASLAFDTPGRVP